MVILLQETMTNAGKGRISRMKGFVCNGGVPFDSTLFIEEISETLETLNDSPQQQQKGGSCRKRKSSFVQHHSPTEQGGVGELMEATTLEKNVESFYGKIVQDEEGPGPDQKGDAGGDTLDLEPKKFTPELISPCSVLSECDSDLELKVLDLKELEESIARLLREQNLEGSSSSSSSSESGSGSESGDSEPELGTTTASSGYVTTEDESLNISAI
jgi:hypothetical protein